MKRIPKRIRRKGRLVAARQIERWLDQASDQMIAVDYEGVIRTCRRILRHESLQIEHRARALHFLGIAHSMRQQYDEAYDAFSEAVTLEPENAGLWYNRGLSSRFKLRLGQSVRDLERAVALEGDGPMASKFAEALAFSRQLAESEMALRGPDFTLEQLIEQEELFQRAVDLMAARDWSRAEETLHQVIEMGDCLPQFRGNLGLCLVMQERYDEAEAALKRAIEIDPEYEHARNNLALLSQTRRSGITPEIAVAHPFEGREIKQSVVFQVEK